MIPEIVDGFYFYVMPVVGDSVQFPNGREFIVRKVVHYVSSREDATTSSVILDPK